MKGKKRETTKAPPGQEPAAEPETVADAEAAVAGDVGAESAPAADPVAEWRDKYMRTLAELDNFRKRVERDRESSRRYAAEGLMRDLLPVLDNLEGAAAAAGGGESIREGVELALRDLLRILGAHGFERIESVGEPFDPNWHEALAQVPSPDHAPGTVVHELRAGYRLHDRILRPSRVHIAMPPPQPEPAQDEPRDEETAAD